MYKYLFGPVPSRRLGMSLGVDLVPHKICSLNCVYCECGGTTKLTVERKEYVPINEVLEELKHFLKNNPAPDYITFSGNGEPTLNSGIGKVLEFIRSYRPKIPVAVLTNGTLLNDKKVRKELLKAELVIPSLDAASDLTFRKIDRNSNKININEYIQGIADFKKEFSGKMILEVLILPDYNDNEKDLKLLKKAFQKIKPDIIQLNTLDRPGTVADLQPASKNELQKISDFWNMKNVKIIASATKRKNIKSSNIDIENIISETISRRPCTLSDLVKITGKSETEINKYLSKLKNENQITEIKQSRGIFFKIS